MRNFIRHPSSIPIDLFPDRQGSGESDLLENISNGGLCCHTHESYEIGSLVRLQIQFVRPTFEVRARVVWRTDLAEGHLVGFVFLDPADLFRARMVEQVCHIEHYRNLMEDRGRTLSPQEAAAEWIKRFGRDFPGQGAEVALFGKVATEKALVQKALVQKALVQKARAQ